MLKDILGTLATRYLIAFLNLALIFVNARALGIEGVGTLGLIWASVSLNVTINSVFSSNTIVYFLSKYSARRLYPIAVLWIFAGSAIGCIALSLLGLLPGGYTPDIYGITVLYSLGIAHSRFLLGKDHIWGFNLTQVLQGGLLFFVVLYFYYVCHRQEIASYLWGLYLTNGVAVIVSLFLLYPYLRPERVGAPVVRFRLMMKEMLAYGLWGSTDNMAETCATRLSYFLVERFVGIGGVGLLDAGTKVAESVWNISRSIASIAYNRVAGSKEKKEQKHITLQLLKLTFLAMSVVMICVLLVPEWVYTDYLFGAEFKGIREVIAFLSVGIVALGCHTILSHYFIGSGKIRYSTFSSCIGLVSLLLAGWLLIPLYGINGSALSSSFAFCMMLLFSLLSFVKITNKIVR
ncbi:MAG: polysaccharide biosynthesis C-terminal domain-containing protein [Tannerellaceae bacterium]|jgi:O-antigen/teichoic acid export membrane protein|nr:polysaccharide biosynthesis C-terminal domain-containing protein [Tannerellaceae bacterium]